MTVETLQPSHILIALASEMLNMYIFLYVKQTITSYRSNKGATGGPCFHHDISMSIELIKEMYGKFEFCKLLLRDEIK